MPKFQIKNEKTYVYYTQVDARDEEEARSLAEAEEDQYISHINADKRILGISCLDKPKFAVTISFFVETAMSPAEAENVVLDTLDNYGVMLDYVPGNVVRLPEIERK